jgi:hypothetical protein
MSVDATQAVVYTGATMSFRNAHSLLALELSLANGLLSQAGEA